MNYPISQGNFITWLNLELILTSFNKGMKCLISIVDNNKTLASNPMFFGISMNEPIIGKYDGILAHSSRWFG